MKRFYWHKAGYAFFTQIPLPSDFFPQVTITQLYFCLVKNVDKEGVYKFMQHIGMVYLHLEAEQMKLTKKCQ